MARAPGGTTCSSSGCGAASNTRRFISRPTIASARPALRSAATWTSTTAADRIRALTTPHPIKPTSTRCHSAWQPNPGRCSTYRRGDSVQTTRTTSQARPNKGQHPVPFRYLQRDRSPVAAQPQHVTFRSQRDQRLPLYRPVREVQRFVHIKSVNLHTNFPPFSPRPNGKFHACRRPIQSHHPPNCVANFIDVAVLAVIALDDLHASPHISRYVENTNSSAQ